MTPLGLFEFLGATLPQGIEAMFGVNRNCILATRVAIEVASYFRIEAYPLAVQVMLFNRQFAAHVEEGDQDVRKWSGIDGSHSVGIGCGFAPGQDTRAAWDGHLIAAAEGCFGDFAIGQAERIDKGIITGKAVVGPREKDARSWRAIQMEHGTVVQYRVTDDRRYRTSPDWVEPGRRRKLAAPLIRALREVGH